MIFLQLFYTFFKIGLFGFGGGYAMLFMLIINIFHLIQMFRKQPAEEGGEKTA